MRCDRCGKFRKAADVVMSDHGDQFGNFDEATECKWCMSPADRERYGLPVEGESDGA